MEDTKSRKVQNGESDTPRVRQGLFSKMFDFYAPLLEVLIWLLLAFFVSYRVLLEAEHISGITFDSKNSLSIIILKNYTTFVLVIFIALVPVLTKLIFGSLPFELIKNYQKERKEFLKRRRDIFLSEEESKLAISRENPDARKEEIKENKDVLADQIIEATQIAEKIYFRSGVYLFVGCMIAFAGVFIFYSPFFTTQSLESKEPLDRFIDFLPRIAALFFVEYVAFFFLKQYRIMMEEYRYYEAIKRKKQNNFLIVNLVEKYQSQQEVLKQILDKCSFNELENKLAKEESTEILETQRIANEEFNIVEKMIDFVKEIRK